MRFGHTGNTSVRRSEKRAALCGTAEGMYESGRYRVARESGYLGIVRMFPHVYQVASIQIVFLDFLDGECRIIQEFR